MLCTNKLSQHAIGQSEAREARHTTPACSGPDKLPQHAINQSEAREGRHTIPACSRSQSQIGKARHTIPAYTAQTHYPNIHCEKLAFIKETAKLQNSGQADTATSCTTRRMRARGAAEEAATTP